MISLPYGHAANSFNCQRGILTLGDSKNDMINKCGIPANSRKSWLNIEYIIYDYGPNRFIRTIKIIDGKVNRINTGGYGGIYGK